MSETKNIWDEIYSNAYLTMMPEADAKEKELIHYAGFGKYVLVPEIVTANENGFIAKPLTKKDSEEYNLGYSEYRIKRAAEINMEKTAPPMLLTLKDYLLMPSYAKDLFSNKENALEHPENADFLILTNRRDFHGAATLLTEGVIDRIHEILNQGFVVVVANEDFCYIVAENIVNESMKELGKTIDNIEEEISRHDDMFWFPLNSTIHEGKHYTTYKMTDEEIEAHPFVGKNEEPAFYKYILEKVCGVNYDEIDYCRCSEIDVAKNIQERWFEQEKKRIIDEHVAKYGYEPNEYTLKEAETQLTMRLVISGPKAMEDLPDNMIRISDTFIEY